MATVSERSREIAIDIEEQCCAGDYVFIGSEAATLIEQALLAERRLARIETFEESAKIADAYRCDCPEHVQHLEVSAEIAEHIRAAAEKEVGK
jgi:hypothetical protein